MGVGVIIEFDIIFVIVFNVIVIGFNVCLDVGVKCIVDVENVDICFYCIIYKVIEEIEFVMKGMFDFEFVEKIIG